MIKPLSKDASKPENFNKRKETRIRGVDQVINLSFSFILIYPPNGNLIYNLR